MALTTKEDLNQKIFMASSFLDSIQLLEKTTNYIFGNSQEEADQKKVETKRRRKYVLHYLYAIVFELCIKIIWGIEQNKIAPHNHDILSFYRDFSENSKEKLTDLYDKQVVYVKYIISESKGQVDSIGDTVDLSHIQFQSLEEALTANAQIIRDFKYDGELSGKSSVLCSTIYDDVAKEIYILPKVEMTVFPKSLLDYAVSLNSS